ncbi:MAG: glucosaminidase domain-containing protein [Lachnospiraceae bacterium]|nr:glucosaminidase domain-containing protein [Lachnospiraceae bacterium]
MATAKQANEFIKRIAPIAQAKAEGRAKWSLPSVCIAQCCCESAYGTSPKMMRANAILGIKVGKSRVHFGTAWKDKAYSTKTKECYDGKTYVNITDMFRAYDNISDAIEDYYDMLASCSRYSAARNRTDPRECITAIKSGGYATGPAYVNTIMNIVSRYNLTQFDGVVTKKDGSTDMTSIHNPYTEPEKNVGCGTTGNDAKWVQWCLWRFGLLEETGIDGVIGLKSVSSIKTAQTRLGLVPDGIVGKNTRKAFSIAALYKKDRKQYH